jgi:hypothetical protein
VGALPHARPPPPRASCRQIREIYGNTSSHEWGRLADQDIWRRTMELKARVGHRVDIKGLKARA